MTNASREHIVTTAARNVGLRDGITAAFIEAALEFCDHETLQYTWMKFLPNKENKAYTDFWSVLVTNIEAKVRDTPLVRPDSGSPLRLITSLRNPRPSFVDGENNLLLRDLTPELRISRHYGPSSLAILENLGLAGFTTHNFIRMVDQDLHSPDSWIKSKVSDCYLQIRVAKILCLFYATAKFISTKSLIEKLPIIPLHDGRWLAATTEERIFFPDTAGLKVPEDLDFNLVESAEAVRLAWRELFELLGVESLSVGAVRERIFQRQIQFLAGSRKIRVYVQQLKFLYSTHADNTHNVENYRTILLIDDSAHRWFTACDDDLYLPDDNPIGPRELLKPITCGERPNENVPGLKVRFIHGLYLQNPPNPPQEDSPTWNDWLVEVIGVRRLLRLVNRDSPPSDLSKACYYVAEHRPEKFLAFLVHNWPHGGSPLEEDPLGTSTELQQKLRKIKVLCQGGHMIELEDTYIPFPDLLSQSKWFLEGKADFPFLQLEELINRTDYTLVWASLTLSLGIGSMDDLDFYLRILLAFSTVQYPTEDDCRRVFRLYSVMHGNYLQAVFKDSSKQTIQSAISHPPIDQWLTLLRSSFKENSLILVPSVCGGECAWVPLADCLWEGSLSMRSRYPLKALMKSFLAEFSSLPTLFVDVLEIPDCDYSHIICELEYLSGKGDSKLEIVSGLYKQLHAMRKSLPGKVRKNIR